MQITVLGAGAMGCLFGGLLAERGHGVTLIDIDAGRVDAIDRHGVCVHTDAGERQVTAVRASLPADAQGKAELLIVFTKAMHTRAAMAGVHHLIGPRTVALTLQNGLGHVEVLGEFVPRSRLLVGVTSWPADLVGPGHVRSHGHGSIRLMTADAQEQPFLHPVVQALCDAGLNCHADPAVQQAIWEKVAFNTALNTLCTVAGTPVGPLARVPDGPALAAEIVREVIAVARAHGVQADAAGTLAKVADAFSTFAGHQPSMLQDWRAGRPTEIEALNGAVVAAAERVGLAVPRTQTLLQLVRLMEAARRSHL